MSAPLKQDIHAMSNTTALHNAAILRNPKRLHWLHSQWLALAALLMTAALAPQAFAASCTGTSALTLTATQWAMVGIPCVPVGISPIAPANVGNVFLFSNPNMTTANYFNGTNAATATWVLWKRTYTGTGDSYTRMAVTDLVETGGAYWLYTTVNGTYRVNGTATPTPFTTPALAAQASGTNRYTLYANPYATNPLNFSALLFPITVPFIGTINFSTAFATSNPTPVPPQSNSYISPEVSYWNGNTYFTRSLTSSPVATFVPNQAAWIKAQPASAAINNQRITADRP